MSEFERRFFRAKANGQPDPWFDADPGRREAFAAMDRIWTDLDAAPDLAAMIPPHRASRRAFMWGGAGLALAAGLGAVAVLPRSDMATGVGQLRTAALPDGSEVLLDAASRMDLDFEHGQRFATLHEGRARFRVAAGDGDFTIAAAQGRVHLRQGEVTVHLWDNEMTVACFAGETRIATTNGDSLGVAAGMETTLGSSGVQPSAPLGTDELQWASGRLVFKDRPLRQVIADIGRYRRGSILLRGEDIRALRVTGVFDAHRPDLALDAITVALSLRRRDLGPVTWLSHA